MKKNQNVDYGSAFAKVFKIKNAKEIKQTQQENPKQCYLSKEDKDIKTSDTVEYFK